MRSILANFSGRTIRKEKIVLFFIDNQGVVHKRTTPFSFSFLSEYIGIFSDKNKFPLCPTFAPESSEIEATVQTIQTHRYAEAYYKQ